MSSRPDQAQLLQQARQGDTDARQQLLQLHRQRLKRMVQVRSDPRLSARLDASDVVQEALAEAARQLPKYLEQAPMPFYPWLRQITWQRLVKIHRRHISAKKRSVSREEQWGLSDDSLGKFARRLFRSASTPSKAMLQKERRDQVRQALDQLLEADREILILRYLEDLSTEETATVLGIGESAAKMRHLRALERLRNLLDEDIGEHSP